MAVDAETNVYVADYGNMLIRKIVPQGTDWVVSTIGGLAGTNGSADGTGANARFNVPRGVAADLAGAVYVADSLNNTIRKGVFAQFGPVNPVPYTSPAMTGKLQVTLLPPAANGQWRFPWEIVWHNSGFIATNLAAGNFPVEFRNIPGWLAIPASLTSSNPAVVTANATEQITNYYYPTIIPSDVNDSAGSLTVYLGANPPSGAGWRFLGDTNTFLVSNFTTNLLPGNYLIEFAGPFTRSRHPAYSIGPGHCAACRR